MNLLLLSNSTNHGQGYLDHAMAEILAFLGGSRSLAFVPFALRDQEGYAARAAARFEREGVTVTAVTPDLAGRKTLLALWEGLEWTLGEN